MARPVLLLVAVALSSVALSTAVAPANMTLINGKTVDLYKIYQDSKGQCCIEAAKVLGGAPAKIVRMSGSGGAYFVTSNDRCTGPILASAYPSAFTHIYVCGQCKGGCPAVDGGLNAVAVAKPQPVQPATKPTPLPSTACPSSGCNRICPNQVNTAQACSCGYTFCFGKCVPNASADNEWTKNGQTPPSCKGN